MIRCAVILPAAGKGQRFAASGRASASKIEHELEGRAVFLRAIDLFHGRPEVEQIILAVDPQRYDEFTFRWGEALGFLNVDVVPGGASERWETVQQALGAVRDGVTHITVHDAARPATPAAVIDRVFASAEHHPAVIPAVPVSSTLKRVESAGGAVAKDRVDDILGLGDPDGPDVPPDALGTVAETVSRANVVAVQTPQVFDAGVLRAAYERLTNMSATQRREVTDDAGLVEATGTPVMVVRGDPGNLKLTEPADAEMLASLLRFRETETKQQDAVRDLFGDEDD